VPVAILVTTYIAAKPLFPRLSVFDLY